MSSRYAIEAEGIAKHFGKRNDGIQALNGVSFTVSRGSVTCILGPNGAGKTTLIRILTTITHPDRGTAKIEGHDILTNPVNVRDSIGVVFQQNHFDRYLTIWHNLILHAQMHGMAKQEYEPRITALLKKVGLYERRFDYTEVLSGGMQRRIALIRAMIHEPKVLFLDEPTTGLDPEARREIWDSIEQFKKHATVILTTHYMEEADLLSDKIIMLQEGKVVMEGTPRELKQAVSDHEIYEIELKTPKAAFYLSKLRMSDVEMVQRVDDYRIRFTSDNPAALREIFDYIDPRDLLRVGEAQADLETVFLSVAGKNPTHPKAEAP